MYANLSLSFRMREEQRKKKNRGEPIGLAVGCLLCMQLLGAFLSSYCGSGGG
jgi:hypothetical protein